MDEKEWDEVIEVACLVAQEIVEDRSNLCLTKEEINEIIRKQLSEIRRVNKIVQELSRELKPGEKFSQDFSERFKESFLDLPEKSQKAFLRKALIAISLDLLENFLEKQGIIVERKLFDDPSFEVIMFFVPGGLRPERLFESKQFGYIRVEKEVFDFRGSLFERTAKEKIHSRNVAGTDEPIGIRSVDLIGFEVEINA